MKSNLALEFLRVIEQTAIECAHTMGKCDPNNSDRVAVDKMRSELATVPVDGTVVVSEGERDDAPMLFIEEKIGMARLAQQLGDGPIYEQVDIAVDPLEGSNLCANGIPSALSVLAVTDPGGLMRAPDIYMEKLVVGPSARGMVALDAPVEQNLAAIARSLDRTVADLVVVVLDRPRHKRLVDDIRRAGARLQLISDGDLSAGIATAVLGSGIHAVMGIGAAPQGLLTAAAMRCLNGEILGRFVLKEPDDEKRLDQERKCAAMGIDFNRVYRTRDMVPGDEVIFAASGVTNGTLLKGVRFFGDGIRTSSLLMRSAPSAIQWFDTIHVTSSSKFKIRF
jgi:fructose-1,6-bisphosphatase class II